MRVSLALGAILSFVAPLSANAGEFEVSPGDDIRTLTGAGLTPGSTFQFNAGTYDLDDQLDWSGVGTAQDPIIMQANGAGEVIPPPHGGGRAVYLHDAQHFEIRNLTFEGDPDYYATDGFNAIRMENVTDILMTNCTARQIGGSAIVVQGTASRLRFLDNEIFDTRDGYGMYLGCGDASCWVQDSEIRGNWIHDVKGDWTAGIGLDTGGQNNVIADNVIVGPMRWGLYTGSTGYGDPNYVEGNVLTGMIGTGLNITGSAVVRNNLVFDVAENALYTDDDGGTLEKLAISYNTFAGSGDWGVEIHNWGNKDGMVFSSNAIANPIGLGIHADEFALDGVYFTNNRVTGYTEGIPEDQLEGIAGGGGFVDFVDAEGWDYYPAANSSLRDNGDPSGDSWIPATDFNGAPREGDAPDVGAYEYSGGENPGWAVEDGFKELDLAFNDGSAVGGCCKKKDKAPEDALILVPVLLFAWAARKRRRAMP